MGVTFYSWTSDQLSQYGTKFVPVTVRDATYVLDELCNNETELPIREHTTDTAGATEIIFALFDLLGFRFAPRLRDLHGRRGELGVDIDGRGAQLRDPEHRDPEGQRHHKAPEPKARAKNPAHNGTTSHRR